MAAVSTWVLLAILTAAFGLLLKPMHHSLVLLSAVYVFAEIRGCLNTVYVVTFSNEHFAGHESKRPYAIVASGAPVAGILLGTFLGFEASVVSLDYAIIAIVVLDLFTAISSWLLPNQSHATGEDQLLDSTTQRNAPAVSAPSNPLGKYQFQLAALMSLKIVVLTLIGYQWKVAVGEFFGDNMTLLVSYFAIFYAMSDALIVLLQVLVAGRMIDRWGIGVGLIGFPIAIAVVALAVFFVDSTLALMLAFTFGKGLNVMRRALHDPSLTVAYTVIDPMIRRETIVFVKGMVKPFAEAIAAVMLLIVGGVVLEIWITSAWFLLTIPWLYFACKVVTAYRKREGPPH